jgi:GH15 family glucan-1,4-alpha-glucosidase
MDLVRWAMRHALPTGALPEQLNPLTGEPLSVAPLTWSHAVLVDALLDLADRHRNLPGG